MDNLFNFRVFSMRNVACASSSAQQFGALVGKCFPGCIPMLQVTAPRFRATGLISASAKRLADAGMTN